MNCTFIILLHTNPHNISQVTDYGHPMRAFFQIYKIFWPIGQIDRITYKVFYVFLYYYLLKFCNCVSLACDFAVTQPFFLQKAKIFSVLLIGPKPAQITISVPKKLLTMRLLYNDFVCDSRWKNYFLFKFWVYGLSIFTFTTFWCKQDQFPTFQFSVLQYFYVWNLEILYPPKHSSDIRNMSFFW